MFEEWRQEASTPAKGKEVRVRKVNGLYVLETRKLFEVITPICTASLVRSSHSNGYYVSILYGGKSILALGIDEASKCIMRQGFKIEKAENAAVSFHILKS